MRLTGHPPLFFATSNPEKLREARGLLPCTIEALSVELEEVQAPSLESIALHKLEQARDLVDGAVFVEDVGLGFDVLGGFPGPYIKWLLRAAGGEGISRIAEGLEDSRGSAICHLAYWDGETVHAFVGRCRGRILSTPRGDGGFGWDAWFLPDDAGRTYAELSAEEKGRISHRAKAYSLFARHLSSGT